MEKNLKPLEVQQKVVHLANTVFEATKKFSSIERSGLISQMRNIAVSIPSNIAESTAKTNKDALRYLVVARGFLNKLDAHVEVSHSIGMIDVHDYKNIGKQIESVDSLLSGLIRNRKLKSK